MCHFPHLPLNRYTLQNFLAQGMPKTIAYGGRNAIACLDTLPYFIYFTKLILDCANGELLQFTIMIIIFTEIYVTCKFNYRQAIEPISTSPSYCNPGANGAENYPDCR
jgi:hypothetical protein